MVLWRYRQYTEEAEWIIYMTDVGQQHHFDMFFSVSDEGTKIFSFTVFLLNLFLPFYRLQGWPVGSQIQLKG